MNSKLEEESYREAMADPYDRGKQELVGIASSSYYSN